MADSAQVEVRNGGGSGRPERPTTHAPAAAFARALAAVFPPALAAAAFPPAHARANQDAYPRSAYVYARTRAAYAHARAYQYAMAYAHVRAYVSLAAKGSGLLALLLSSVVLLGGYVQSLGKEDFWCITAISLIQALGIFEDWENSIEYLVDFFDSILVLMDELSSFMRSFSFNGLVIYYLSSPVVLPLLIVLLCVQLLCMLGPFTCAAISLWRIAKLDHGNRDGTDSMANMMAALNIFYSLVTFQGTLFAVLLLTVTTGESVVTLRLHALDQLSEKWAKKAIHKYISDISAKCRKDPLSIKGMDLIKYAVELLDSESQEDYLYGSRLLSAFIKKGEDVRSLLLPSRQKIQKLIDSLRISSSLHENTEVRELAATIVADLAGHIDLAKYPESLRYISSLLQEETTQTYWNIKHDKQIPYPQRPIGPLTEEEQWRQDLMRREERRQWRLMADQKRLTIREERPQQNRGGASYELILQCLTILERLASNNDNCRLICSAPSLLPKITAPVYSRTLIQDVKIKAWTDIVTRSLKLLYQLIRAPGQTSRRLRREISSNDQALSNLESILDMDNEAGQELQLPALAILTELALDLSINLAVETKKNLITKQLQVFLDNGEGGESAAMAGRTLVSLSTNRSNCALIMTTREDIIDRLTEILVAENNITHRKIAAEITENLCAHFDVDRQHMKEKLLPKILNEIMSIKRESQQRNISADQNNSASGDEENQNKEIFLAEYPNKSYDKGSEEQEAFLSLALVISQKLNSADGFDSAIQNTIGREEFVDTLKDIIDKNCQATSDSVRIVKLCAKIAESMIQCQQYAEYFRNKGLKSSLSKASETMSRLESCMLFYGTYFGQKKTVRPLISDIEKIWSVRT